MAEPEAQKCSKKNPKGENTKREKQRLKNLEAGVALKPPASIRLQVLGTGTNCTVRSLLVDFSTHKYLFNCTEGTQRVLNNRKAKLSRIENVFITKSTWKNLSGLSGFYLTIDGTLVPCLKVCGPKVIQRMMELAGSFAEGKTTRLEISGIWDGAITDEGMRTEMIQLISTRAALGSDKTDKTATKTAMADDEKSITSGIDTPTKARPNKFKRISAERRGSDRPVTKKAKLEREKQYCSSQESESSGSHIMEDEKDLAIAYLCQPHPAARKVCVQKILELGIPRDKTIGQLVNGKTVILEDGREIKPDDILNPELVEAPFLVVECFDSTYLPSLNNATALQQFYTDGEQNVPEEPSPRTAPSKEKQSQSSDAVLAEETMGKPDKHVGMVIHFTAAEVIQQQDYQQWMKRFGSRTKHLVLNEWGSDMTLLKPLESQICLNQIHPTIFPLLKQQVRQSKVLEAAPLDVENVQIGHPGLSYLIRGTASEVDKYNSDDSFTNAQAEEYITELDSEELRQEKEVLQKKLNSFTDADMIDERHYPEVVFLGTGSAIPSPVRNVSGIVLHLSEDACMLLDCGEGTVGQITRFYGDKAGDVFCSIKAIFISHRHADHHMGLAGILLERDRVMSARGLTATEPIVLVAPYRYQNYIESLDNIFGIELQKRIKCAASEHFQNETSLQVMTLRLQLEECSLPITSLRTCKVVHKRDPFGLVMVLDNGFKIVYSGDTMPCEDLVKAGEGCDLLIHEATMSDGLEEEAKKKSHSTTSQAIKIGEEMRAKFTILTHFSQRYSKIPLINDDFDNRVGIAFDNMKVCPRDFHVLPSLIPAAKALWQEEYQEMEHTLDLQQLSRKQMQEKTEEEKERNEDRNSESCRNQKVEHNPQEGNKQRVMDDILADPKSEMDSDSCDQDSVKL